MTNSLSGFDSYIVGSIARTERKTMAYRKRKIIIRFIQVASLSALITIGSITGVSALVQSKGALHSLTTYNYNYQYEDVEGYQSEKALEAMESLCKEPIYQVDNELIKAEIVRVNTGRVVTDKVFNKSGDKVQTCAYLFDYVLKIDNDVNGIFFGMSEIKFGVGRFVSSVGREDVYAKMTATEMSSYFYEEVIDQMVKVDDVIKTLKEI